MVHYYAPNDVADKLNQNAETSAEWEVLYGHNKVKVKDQSRDFKNIYWD